MRHKLLVKYQWKIRRKIFNLFSWLSNDTFNIETLLNQTIGRLMSVEQVHLPPMALPLILCYTVHYSPWWALRNHNFIHYAGSVTFFRQKSRLQYRLKHRWGLPLTAVYCYHLSQLTRQYRTETIHLPQSCTRRKKVALAISILTNIITSYTFWGPRIWLSTRRWAIRTEILRSFHQSLLKMLGYLK